GDVKRGKIFIVGGPNPNGSFSGVYFIGLASGCLGALASQKIKIVYKSKILKPDLDHARDDQIHAPPLCPKSFHTSTEALPPWRLIRLCHKFSCGRGETYVYHWFSQEPCTHNINITQKSSSGPCINLTSLFSPI
ncbi:hypothetical protein HPG69_009683, partial [Diceros bicornis minor]